MEFKDYYQILDLEKIATSEEIEAAYQKNIQSQPAKNDDDSAANLSATEEAYQVLSQPDKRAKYDRLRAAWQIHQNKPDAPPFDWTQWTADTDVDAETETTSDYSEFYTNIFAQLDQPYVEPQQGADYNQTVEISLEEAYSGAGRILRIGKRRIEVKIPRGAATGTKVRVRGEGGPGRGGAAKGDLYLEIKVTDHPLFTRQKNDLHVELPLDLYTAVLGGEAIVPMLKGKVKLKIPPETQSGRSFRLKGHGMPNIKQSDERGDLFVRILVQIPQELTDEEIALFEELADLRGL
jgi:curved DNA-binding protein